MIRFPLSIAIVLFFGSLAFTRAAGGTAAMEDGSCNCKKQPSSRLGMLTAISNSSSSKANASSDTSSAKLPNIVFIYGDDVGYGDLGCYGASKVKTPNLNQLASEGLRFTDAHSSSATCTPSRYSVLTGEYPWRKKGTGILPGDAGLIIEPGRLTLPAMLKKAGYATGAVGKWHLGLGKPKPDWNGDIQPGPLEIGFDYSFIIPATADRVPCVFVRNHRVVNLDPKDPITVSYTGPLDDEPLGRDHPELLKMKYSRGHDMTIVNGISRIGYMKGGKSALWVDDAIAGELTGEAIYFMEQHKDGPFFLYFATHDIHVPHAPGPTYAGKSECGIRGDTIEQLDGCTGAIVAALDRLGLTDNTLIIFSSDNGPVVDDGYADGSVRDLNGHKPAGPYRGGKYTSWEGGTRMPFIVRWKDKVKPGVSDALICQTDFLASFAALVGQELPADAAPDSRNVLPALLGESPTGRENLVEQGGPLAFRQGTWKLFPAGPGREEGGPPPPKTKGPMLFDLANDPGETKDLAEQEPERVKAMAAAFEQIKGSPQQRSAAKQP